MQKVFKARNYTLPLGEKTYVMGILNVTPDSFSDGGKWFNIDSAVEHALQMQNDGADIIDIGAQSTRPGYTKISAEEEENRLIPFLKAVRKAVSVPISIDTFYPSVAEKSLEYGADIINDVTGYVDEEMYRISAKSDCGCIIMHDKADGIKEFFESVIEKCDKYGIARERVCLDPGIGFNKSHSMNLEILRECGKYRVDECAILIGASRKRVIGAACGNPPFDQRLAGTIAAHTLSIASGADIIRVHDVAEAVQAARVADSIVRGYNGQDCY